MRKLAPLALALVCALVAIPVGTAGAGGFMTGFADGIYEISSTPGVWLDRTVAAGAQLVLLPVDWAAISPQPPPAGTSPSDPANPEYNWGTLDTAVRGATARGLTVAFTVAGGGGGPPWADGPHRPASAQPGTWRPNAGALESFARALARRYSGGFDPGGGVLPRVRYYQGWSEPNLPNHLTPQWVRVRGHWVAESAIIYRGLLNAFYAGVKSVNRSNLVITGGTAPFGDPPGGPRVPPAAFVRQMLCLNGRLAPQRCPNPAHFDILAHHPYSVGGPFQHAFNPDDASLPDIGKLTRPLAVARRTGRALPRGRKQVWVTEFSWDSKPPDPHAVPMGTWERWMQEAFYELWSEGVDAIAWYLLVDQPCVPSCADSYQSGVYYVNGSPKPGLSAFRFPFVVRPRSHRKTLVWGISPEAGTVLVQRLSTHGWRTVARFRVGAHGVFTRTLRVGGHPSMRAVVGGETSLTA